MKLSNLPRRALQAPIWIYRVLISPFLGSRCRYLPTCSAYAMDALNKYGAIKGGALAIKRFCRCHPFSKHPHDDPVP